MKYYFPLNVYVIPVRDNEEDLSSADWIFCIQDIIDKNTGKRKIIVERTRHLYNPLIGLHIFGRIKSKYSSILGISHGLMEERILPCLESLILTSNTFKEFYPDNQQPSSNST